MLSLNNRHVHKGLKGTILPIAVMAFAIVAFLLLVFLAIEPSPTTNNYATNQDTDTLFVNSSGKYLVTIRTVSMVDNDIVLANIPLVVSWSELGRNQSVNIKTDKNGRAEFLLPQLGTMIEVSVDLKVRGYTGGIRTTIWTDNSTVIVKLLEVLG